MIVAGAVSELSEKRETEAIVVGNVGGVQVCRVFEAVQPAHASKVVRKGGRGSKRFFRDDVDDTRDGRTAV